MSKVKIMVTFYTKRPINIWRTLEPGVFRVCRQVGHDEYVIPADCEVQGQGHSENSVQKPCLVNIQRTLEHSVLKHWKQVGHDQQMTSVDCEVNRSMFKVTVTFICINFVCSVLRECLSPVSSKYVLFSATNKWFSISHLLFVSRLILRLWASG